MSFSISLQVQFFGTINVALQSLNAVSRRLNLKQEKINPPMFAKWSFPLIADGLLVPSLLESKCLPAPFRVTALLTQKKELFYFFFFPISLSNPLRTPLVSVHLILICCKACRAASQLILYSSKGWCTALSVVGRGEVWMVSKA